MFRLHPECVLNLPGMRGQDVDEERDAIADREERPSEDKIR